MAINADYEFDAALSFAGEDRAYVQEVAAAMKAAGISYFLDTEHLAETWGEDLAEFFDKLFRERAKYAVVFTSVHYRDKMWPRQERRSALARAVEEKGAYILPVLLDDTEIDGFRPTVGHMDSRRYGIDRIVAELVNKLTGRAGSPDAPIDHAPRDEAETRRLIDHRPDGWEYLLLAGSLRQELAAHEDRYRDFEAHFRSPSSVRVPEEDVWRYLQGELATIRTVVDNWTGLLNGTALSRALGAPGEPGDPDRIRHLAARMTTTYVQLMDWSQRIAGAACPGEYRRLFDILSRFADQPVEEYREWVGAVVEAVDAIPGMLARGETPAEPIELMLTLTLSEAVQAEWKAEIDRLERGLPADDDFDQLP